MGDEKMLDVGASVSVVSVAAECEEGYSTFKSFSTRQPNFEMRISIVQVFTTILGYSRGGGY